MPEGLQDFLDRTKHKPAAKLLVEWVPKLGLHGGIALDLGCGAGAEAEFLGRHGFMVDAIDKSETAVKYARERTKGLDVNVIEGDFREFELRPDYYTLVTSINALPFLPKEDAKKLLGGVQAALKVGGAAILAVFGPEHAWADRADMSFWTFDEFRALWDGWTVHHLEEHKGMWPLVSGQEIFQHRIHLVAQKP